MADQRKKVLLPPTYSGQNVTVREILNPAYVEADRPQQGKSGPLPLPDYETLFPQRRHGVQGQTKWDHIIAEVNQKHRDTPAQFLEMSVDGPEEPGPNPRSFISQESPIMKSYTIKQQERKPISTKTTAAPAPPPKPATSSHALPVADASQKQSQSIAFQPPPKPSRSPATAPGMSEGRASPIGRSRDETKNALPQSPAAKDTLKPSSQTETALSDDQRTAPTAKPRQKGSGKEPTQEDESVVTLNESLNRDIQTLSSSNVSTRTKKSKQTEEFADPFPSSDLLANDPWAQPMHHQEVDDVFTGTKAEQKSEDGGTTDFDDIFTQQKAADPFAGFDAKASREQIDKKKDEDVKTLSPAFQRRNSSRTRNAPLLSQLNNKGSKPQEQAPERGVTVATARQDLHAGEVTHESATPQPHADVKVQSAFSGTDLFGAEPFTVPSGSTSSQPLQVVTEEPPTHSEGLSGGRKVLRARVSPSEVSPVSAQNSIGGGLGLTPRR